MDTQISTEEIPKQKPKSTGARIGGVVGIIVGMAAGRYCGIHLLIPLILCLAWLGFSPRFHPVQRHFAELGQCKPLTRYG
jgi:hypothetical protein